MLAKTPNVKIIEVTQPMNSTYPNGDTNAKDESDEF